MASPPTRGPADPDPVSAPPVLSVVEASPSREWTCARCGHRTSEWKPVRRRGTSLTLCLDCAAKPVPSDAEGCPSCGGHLRPRDRFCGKCGSGIVYGCPTCEATLDAEDVFCGRCGAQVA